jgi:hypothetical protein
MSWLSPRAKLPATPALQQQLPSFHATDAVPFFYGRQRVGAHWLSDSFNWLTAGKSTPFEYASIAAAHAQGPVDFLGNVWVNGLQIWAVNATRGDEDYIDVVLNPSTALGQPYSFRFYWGTETQNPDAYLVAGTGQDHPAYRGIAYSVWHNMDLGQGNTSIPQIEFEIGRKGPTFGAYGGTGTQPYGVNPFAAIYGFCTEEKGGLGLVDGLDPATWAAAAQALETKGVLARQGELVMLNPIASQQTTAESLFSQILTYVDGFMRQRNGKLEPGWFPNQPVDISTIPEITEDDIVGSISSGTFKDGSDALTQLTTAFTDGPNNQYQTEGATARAPANRATAPSVIQNNDKLDRPFANDVGQAGLMAQEQILLSSIPSIDGVVLQILRSRAVNLDGTPLLPGDLFLWNYAPLDMELICRAEERVEDPSKGHVQITFCGEHGEFPMPFVKAADPRVGITQAPPVDINTAKVRIYFLPPGLGGGREITALIDRPGTADTGTQLWMSPSGAAPWQLILDSGFFSALCAASGAIGTGDGTVSLSSSSLDFNRMQGQSAQAQTNDTLLLLVDNELMSVGAVTAAGAGVYNFSVLRGRCGTIAATHAADAPAWLFYNDEMVAVTWKEFYNVRTAGVYDATVAKKYFKFGAHSYSAVGNLVPADPGFAFVFPDLSATDSINGVRVFYQDTAPQGQLNVGDLWYDTDDGNREYRWDGSEWVDVSDGRLTTVSTGLSTIEATISGVEASLASDIASVEATIAGQAAAIVTEQTTRADADESLASSITAMTASLDGNIANLGTEETTRATADSALSAELSEFSATMDGITASVDVLAAAYVLDGEAIATWGFQLDGGGEVVGMEAIAASGGSQASTGVIVFSGATLQSSNFNDSTAGWALTPDGDFKAGEYEISPGDDGRTNFSLGNGSQMREDWGIILQSTGDGAHNIQVIDAALLVGFPGAGNDFEVGSIYVNDPNTRIFRDPSTGNLWVEDARGTNELAVA